MVLVMSFKRSQAENSDLLIALTSSDELNILSCLISKKIVLNIQLLELEILNILVIGMISNELGISLIVNPELEAAKEISRILRSLVLKD